MQAARGTPVGTARTRLRLVFAAVALLAYTADQVTKVLAVAHLGDSPDKQLVGDVLKLTLTYNPGAAFSTGTGLTPLISVVAIVATCAVLYYARRIGSTAWAVALGLLLAGITGNLTDRILRDPGPLRGHVVDFLRLPSWPVFNIADVCINVAAGLIVLQAVRGIAIDGTRGDHEADDDDATAGTDTGTDHRAETLTDPATGDTDTDAAHKNPE